MLRYWRVLALVAALLAVGAYQLYGVFSNVGYRPEQPIHYSHVLHAGVMKMECMHCHFNAERSPIAGVPALDVCMGCHGTVRTDSPEIQKLIEYYESGKPVPWKRVHKVPDHAYFSHQWHVEAGVSCQTCHGPVEQMEIVGQVRKLNMGDCMSCHRQDDYLQSVEHWPTWQLPVAGEAAEGEQDLAQAYVDSLPPEEWASVVREFRKYHADTLTPSEAQFLVHRMKEYQEDIYYHGWQAQLRNMNASVECNVCHQ